MAVNRVLGLAAVAALGTTLIAAPAHAETNVIYGLISCDNGFAADSRPVGIWVDTYDSGNVFAQPNGKSGWAEHGDVRDAPFSTTATDIARGSYTSWFRFDGGDSEKFKLTVGCGGTPENWENSEKTGKLDPGKGSPAIDVVRI